MALGQQQEQQVIARFWDGYVRYEVLLARLALQQPVDHDSMCRYPALQHFLAQQHASSGGSSMHGRACPGDGDAFIASLSAEADRVQHFISSHLERLWVQLLEHIQLLRRASAAASSGQAVEQPPSGLLSSVEATLGALGEDLCLIEQFARQNVVACAKLAQARDLQGTGGSGESEQPDGAYLACMESRLLGDARLDPIIVGLSDAYELLRGLQSHAMGQRPATWVPPERFQRLTRKFWVQPADVTRFKCQVIKHLPVLIFGERRKLTEVAEGSALFLADQYGLRDSSIISSVYFDNPRELNTYHTRLRKEDCATAVRVRWYGERSLSGDQQLFVERKLHRDSWSGQFSSKDRAAMQQRFLADYLAGVGCVPGMEGDSSKAELLQEVQEYLTDNKQVPLLRTVYRRTAFQKSSDNIVRISLDTELQMVKELGAQRVPGDWCRDMAAPLGPDEATQFPYGVVEIKLQAKPPQWIRDLVQSGILLPLPRFSKFLHGVGVLYQDMVEQLPNWFLPDEADPTLLTPATWEEMADTSDTHLQKAAAWLFPSNFDPPPAGASPFSFLRRTKTAPPAAAAPGTDRSAAAAAARRYTEFDLACERLPEAELDPQETEEAEGRSGCGGGQGGGEAVAAAAVSTAELAGDEGTVARRQTWPVYQSPAGGGVGGSVVEDGFLPASYLALGFASAGVGVGAAAQRQQAVPSATAVHAVSNPLLLEPLLEGAPARESGHGSASSTPVDSAKDLESGKAFSDEEKGLGLKQQLSSGPPPQLGLQQRLPAANAFGVQLYKQMAGSRSTAAGASELVGRGGGSSQATKKGASSRAAALVRTRVEPKTFFANERTFLAWLQISVLVMMIAFALLSGTFVNTTMAGTGVSSSSTGCPAGDKSCLASKISGAIIAPVALLFMAYSLFMYKKRTIQILRRETVRYDDQRGPVLLVLILLFVMVTAYVVSVIWIF